MKRIVYLLAALLTTWCSRAWAISLVQQNENWSGSTSVQVALASPVNTGDILIAVYGEESSSYNPSFSSNPSAAWHTCPTTGVPVQDSSGNSSVMVAYATITSGGSTSVTATLAGAEVQVMNVSEWSGLAASPLDVCGGGITSAGTTTSNSPSAGSVTITGNSGDLVIGGASQNCSYCSASSGPTNGFIALTGQTIAGQTLFPAYQIASVPGAFSSGWTSSGQGPWAGILLALKQAAITPQSKVLIGQ